MRDSIWVSDGSQNIADPEGAQNRHRNGLYRSIVRQALATSSGCDPAAVLIDDALAVLLKKFALLRRQEVDH